MAWPYKFFTIPEMECKCGCGLLPTPEFMVALDALREKLGKPMKVTSGARCAVHNAKVGGSSRSKHLEGIAVDIAGNSAKQAKILKLAIESGSFHGIGIAKTFIHLDIRPLKDARVWSY